MDQGRNVRIGDHLVDVADLSSVWVWADVYENELSSFRLGQKVKLTTAAYPGQEFAGTISLINPFLDARAAHGQGPHRHSEPGLPAAPGHVRQRPCSLRAAAARR